MKSFIKKHEFSIVPFIILLLLPLLLFTNINHEFFKNLCFVFAIITILFRYYEINYSKSRK